MNKDEFKNFMDAQFAKIEKRRDEAREEFKRLQKNITEKTKEAMRKLKQWEK